MMASLAVGCSGSKAGESGSGVSGDIGEESGEGIDDRRGTFDVTLVEDPEVAVRVGTCSVSGIRFLVTVPVSDDVEAGALGSDGMRERTSRARACGTKGTRPEEDFSADPFLEVPAAKVLDSGSLGTLDLETESVGGDGALGTAREARDFADASLSDVLTTARLMDCEDTADNCGLTGKGPLPARELVTVVGCEVEPTDLTGPDNVLIWPPPRFAFRACRCPAFADSPIDSSSSLVSVKIFSGGHISSIQHEMHKDSYEERLGYENIPGALTSCRTRYCSKRYRLCRLL
jgi:hypothetical protein